MYAVDGRHVFCYLKKGTHVYIDMIFPFIFCVYSLYKMNRCEFIFLYSGASTASNIVIDWSATTDARWKSHLGQLVPCKKCKRTFNPDRVSIHEGTCKGI